MFSGAEVMHWPGFVEMAFVLYSALELPLVFICPEVRANMIVVGPLMSFWSKGPLPAHSLAQGREQHEWILGHVRAWFFDAAAPSSMQTTLIQLLPVPDCANTIRSERVPHPTVTRMVDIIQIVYQPSC